MTPFIIAVDFDGTIVDHQYPDIGQSVPGALEWLKRFQAAGARLILWTMRCHDSPDGDTLAKAVEYCAANGLDLWGINNNPEQNWSGSPKAYAHVYIDDSGVGCPLLVNPRVGGRNYVDWDRIGPAIMFRIAMHKAATT
jgi:hypothetical protein